MRHHYVRRGTRLVIIIEDLGTFTARLYVNNGETASLNHWRGKTLAGAQRWAQKIVTS